MPDTSAQHPDYNAIIETITPIIMDAGNILLRGYHDSTQEITKTSAIDIVTETDRESEVFIIGALMRHFPSHHIVGEEGGGAGADKASAPYRWYVDPIDGTVNFAHRIPHFCISIALAGADDVPVLGMIYDPMRDELYSAYAGGGATMNHERLQVSQRQSLGESVLASGFGYDKHTTPDNNLAQWGAFVKQVRGVRRMGSAALDFAYIASGRYDGYWERSLNPWDAMAGIVLVREAGGRVTDYRGGERPQDDPRGRYTVSNGRIHDAMLAVLHETYGSEGL